MEHKNKFNMTIISIIISSIIILVGIVFIYLSIDQSEIWVKNKDVGRTVGLGYPATYGADFYTEMSLNTKYIASATKATYYLIERSFGILFIIIGVFSLLHNIKQLKTKNIKEK